MAIARIGQPREAEVPDIPIGESLGYESESEAEYRAAIKRLAQSIEEKTRYVDEYGPVGNAAGWTVSQVTLNPQFEDYYERIKRVIVNGPQLAALAPVRGSANVTDPAANVTIASAGVVPAGTYTVNWTVSLEGTIAAGDADNMGLFLGGTKLFNSTNPGVAGTYPQNSTTITAGGATTLQVKSIAAASGVSAVYSAQISATPVSGSLTPFTLQLGDRFWNLLLPSTGILEFSADILLGRNDIRQLTGSIPGQWFLELTGEADVRNRPAHT